ncbi:hypothetical protein WJX72_001993 [[Myrmecia] bisecta]|uniref:Nucleoplasmin-like domain-containing protein n=1 Tax=[Myrmecia] bisecta TaxID=41462 RepID=A0AAW1QPG5_9CHLO
MANLPEPDVEFFGIKVPKGKPVVVNQEHDQVEDAIIAVHATQVALGESPQSGRHTIFAEAKGGKFVIGTLEKDRCEQFQVDYMATDEVRFSHSGNSDVYITGYKTTTPTLDDDMPGYDMDDSSEEEEEAEDDEPVPRAVTIANGVQKPKVKSAKQQMLDVDAEDTDDDGEPDSDEEDGLNGEMEGEEFSDMDDSDDDEESDDEEAPKNGRKVTLQPAGPKARGALAAGDDDDDDDDDGDDEEDDDDEDGEEEDEEPVKPTVPTKGQKRAAGNAATPQPLKKSKSEPQAKAPATAPAKVQAGKGKGGEAAQFEAALKQHLQAKGATKLATLGTAVKRPQGVTTKLKKFLEDHPDVFKVDPQQIVSLV